MEQGILFAWHVEDTKIYFSTIFEIQMRVKHMHIQFFKETDI